MTDWDLQPPPEVDLQDRQVPQLGHHLDGKRIALLITGGIAAMKSPFVARSLRRYGAEVVAFCSPEALRYVGEDALAWSTVNPVVKALTAKAEHLSDDAPFDAYLVAPATYNTINKAVLGIADTAVTTVLGSAIGRMERGRTSVLIAPTMHGTLHNSILTKSLESLRDLGVRIIPPREAYGKHNIPETEVLTAEVIRAVSSSSLRGVGVLVTGGPTPVRIDNVQRLTSRFRGRLGIEIARELHFRGAEVLLIHGDGAFPVPTEIPHRIARTYDDYRRLVHEELDTGRYQQGIFSAGVPDYRPQDVADGTIPSGSNELVLKLMPTAKIIDEVSERHPELHMVTFKYQEGISHDRLIEIAQARLERFDAVVANRGEEVGPAGEQIAWFLARGAEPVKLMGNEKIAEAIVGHLEHRDPPSQSR
jgi:phosphopantothenoylcysteine decarboxylase/phosphopantothenate--cysteine ligase